MGEDTGLMDGVDAVEGWLSLEIIIVQLVDKFAFERG